MAGAVMAGLGFYILTGEAFWIISNDAVINARVAIVRSPNDGVLNLKSLMIGRRVQAREALGSVTDRGSMTPVCVILNEMPAISKRRAACSRRSSAT